MWKLYFKFVKLKPGRVITAQFGEIDFSADKVDIEIIKALYESDFPYLQITDEGKKELYGIIPVSTQEKVTVTMPEKVKPGRVRKTKLQS